MIKSIIFSLWLCLALSAHSQCSERYLTAFSEDYILHSDISYGGNFASNGDFIDLLLDVYEPVEDAPDNALKPVVILAHGGSFTGGNKRVDEVSWFCEDLARRGIVAVSINYRLEESLLSLISREQMVKAVIRASEDMKAAVRFMHRSSQEGNPWNIDAESIFIGGTSAGSIAALHTAYMDDYGTLSPNFQQWIQDLEIDTIDIEGNSGNSGYSSEIAGVINISGAIGLLDFIDNNADLPILSAHNTVDLSVPFKFGRPYFIPTLPMVAGSKPIHYRVSELGGDSRLLIYPAINHVPHTDYDQGKLEREYNEILDAMSELVGEYSTCSVVLNDVNDLVFPELSIYPNPANRILNLKGLDLSVVKEIRLIDATGALLQTYPGIAISNHQLALPDLANGLYFLQLTTNKGLQTSRPFTVMN